MGRRNFDFGRFYYLLIYLGLGTSKILIREVIIKGKGRFKEGRFY